MLYVIYAFPNIILPLFGGYFVDYTGLRVARTVFSALIVCGSSIFALGCTFESYPVTLVGRLVFGMGAESLIVAQNVFIVRWFRG